jgi:hypothetical protein
VVSTLACGARNLGSIPSGRRTMLLQYFTIFSLPFWAPFHVLLTSFSFVLLSSVSF